MAAHSAGPRAPLQLLILLARLELSAPQRQAALALCRTITSWPELAGLAERQFILPLVYRHLQELAPPSLAPSDMAQLRQRALAQTQRNLLVAGEQQRLVMQLLDPLRIPHLFFKGYALAACYYDEPGMRSCRDIDLLVPRHHCVELLSLALRQGYSPLDPEAMTPDRQSLDFAVRTKPVVSLASPSGVTIEVHHEIDRGAGIYHTNELLKQRIARETGGSQLNTMTTSELFVYICLHHTRHYWSHLHWLVDLDAIQRHPEFNEAEVHACATRRGLVATVDACRELYRALSAPDPEHSAHLSRHSQAMLTACLTALQGDHETELTLRRKRPTPEFGFAWQTTPAYRYRSRLQQWKGRFAPEYIDYRLLPLPPRWQWLYYAIRPYRALARRRQLWLVTR